MAASDQCLSRPWLNVIWFGSVVAIASTGPAGDALAADPSVGFLVARAADGKPDAGSDMARETVERLIKVTAIQPTPDGRFVDQAGVEVAPERFGMIWCHDDETSQKSTIFSPRTLQTLRRFSSAGHGLLLSGGAVALAGPLGIDTVRLQPLDFGNDRAQAGLIPLAGHPAFQGADLDRGVLWMTNAVFPAFAEFHPLASPARGMILAQTPGGPENPLLEYPLGQGRVIVLGWRFGRLYNDAPAPYRRNFEHLASNLVRYLGDARSWLPLAMHPDGRPLNAGPSPAVPEADWHALELAVRDLMQTFGGRYPGGAHYLERLEALRGSRTLAPSDLARRFRALREEALLANPLLDFPQLLLVKRGAGQLGLPMNYLSNSSLPQTGYDNQIATLSPVRPGGTLRTLYQPEGGRFVGDVDLHFDANRLLFSMPGSNGRWQVCEIHVDGSHLRELPLIRQPDVDNYDACYLPDGRVIFASTACFTGVPCVNGTGHVCNLYLLGTHGEIRQLTVEQDHDWCPTVLNDGRILYLRWEYTDLPHAFSRILFHMNPDGTGQSEYYGSNSYWPASMFYARPIPGHPTKVVAVVGGHHEEPRMGDLVIFDPALGRSEAAGAVQRIPGHGRPVVPVIADLPIAQSWPKFLHPYPLSDKYFLVSCKPSADALWGIYLVDVFDNSVLLCEQPGHALFEPIPLRARPRPPIIPDRIDTHRSDAEVFVADIYRGDGLAGVPRGTIKSLRVIGYQFAYQGMGAEPYSVGLDGPWDPKRVLGTVPVAGDGSAHFRAPACTPFALQPLDAEGKAVQLMRSWITAMPGEVVSCVGCHEPQNTAPPVQPSIASGRPPTDIKPWYGPTRGFAFLREVQPVLDRNCLACHDGKAQPDGHAVPDFRDGELVPAAKNQDPYNLASRFSPSYYQLRRFVRTPTKESDLHLLLPWEFHADTTRLVRMLQQGHQGVELDSESWDRLITWIDLNAPAHGNWTDIRGGEIGPEVRHQAARRREMRRLYTGLDDDGETVYPTATAIKPAVPKPPCRAASAAPVVECPGWPFDSAEATRRQHAGSAGRAVLVTLAPGITLGLVPIPAGEFVMGQPDGCGDEQPATRVKIASPFWMGRCEVTNEQYALFDPTHDSRFEPGDYIEFSPGERGWSVSRPAQPVVRVSWNEAMGFCRWLSQRTGRPFTLPSEAQWEYACRAGTATPLWYGLVGGDFSAYANLSDATHQAIDPFSWAGRVEALPAWRPADPRFNDGSRVSAPVGRYRPNPWGLFDMHGNVAEWTRSEYRPYPFRDDITSAGKKVVRGGSWYDRPEHARSAFRQAFRAEQPVFDIGFRVICQDEEGRSSVTTSRIEKAHR